ncbi:hypothetical protein [Bradyrhizobium sp. STM 3562]|uniref:hypothetical protein n=1 Tax=Bradyrhizobium sp. STM 3562 TaxID=578924 RepID=UPI003890744F
MSTIRADRPLPPEPSVARWSQDGNWLEVGWRGGADPVTAGWGKGKFGDPSHPPAEANRRVQVVNMADKTTALK